MNGAQEATYGTAAVELAKRLPTYHHEWATGRKRFEPVHPHMPEDDAAVDRCFRDLIQRGDHLSAAIGNIEQAFNQFWNTLYDAEGCLRDNVEARLWAACDDLGETIDSNNGYDWRKARERMHYVATGEFVKTAEQQMEAQNG